MNDISDQLKSYLTNVNITKNGYFYVYCSNESDIDVFFDNVQVSHVRGPLLEETHHYPFGLTMAGISSKAAGKLENRFKYNEGTERTTDLDLNWDETDFRSYDAQIGRFLQVDRLANEFDDLSPYVYANNTPTLLNDPTGLLPEDNNTLPEVVVTGIRHKKTSTLQLPFNMPGLSQRKNYQYSPFERGSQRYIPYQAWDHTTVSRNVPVTELLASWGEFAITSFPIGRAINGMSWAFKLNKLKQVIGLARLAHASKFGINSYNALRALKTPVGTQVHHLIERRFAGVLGEKAGEMASIVVTKEEHQIFTNAWR